MPSLEQSTLKRNLLASLLATICACCCSAILGFLPAVVLGIENWSDFLGGLILVFVFSPIITLMLFGIPLFLITWIIGMIIHLAELKNAYVICTVGILLGLFCGWELGFISLNKATANYWNFVFALPVSGALSGWVYWRIAVKDTKRARLTSTDQ